MHDIAALTSYILYFDWPNMFVYYCVLSLISYVCNQSSTSTFIFSWPQWWTNWMNNTNWPMLSLSVALKRLYKRPNIYCYSATKCGSFDWNCRSNKNDCVLLQCAVHLFQGALLRLNGNVCVMCMPFCRLWTSKIGQAEAKRSSLLYT